MYISVQYIVTVHVYIHFIFLSELCELEKVPNELLSAMLVLTFNKEILYLLCISFFH